MTQACFNSQVAGDPVAGAAHNARDWTDDHPAPKYIRDFAGHADPRGNESGGPFLTRDQVRDEYLSQTDYGRRTGKVHNRARLFREAVINCTVDTDTRQVKKLIKTLEKKLGIRCMAWHLHRDEGHVDKNTGEPKHNYHLHLEYTNFKDGQVTHMNKARMRQAQDICADVLGMSRGQDAGETGRTHLSRAEYRRLAEAVATERARTSAARGQRNQVTTDNATLTDDLASERTAHGNTKTRAAKAEEDLDEAQRERDEAKLEYKRLGELNKDIRDHMKDTGEAHKKDYQDWKKELADKDKTYEEKEAAGNKLIGELRARAEAAETVRDKETERADQAEANLVTDREKTKNLKADLETTRQQGEQALTKETARATQAEKRAEKLEEELPASGWVPLKTKGVRKKPMFGAEYWEATETASEYRRRTQKDVELFLDKQRRKGREELKAEKRKVRDAAKEQSNFIRAFENSFDHIWGLPNPALRDLFKEIGLTITRFLDRRNKPAPEPTVTRSRTQDQERDDW